MNFALKLTLPAVSPGKPSGMAESSSTIVAGELLLINWRASRNNARRRASPRHW
ncbi:MAG: hypothetical protein MZV63_61185 [Marinilabiliales bacterium]|nr:hypothetical protein [Marinilabiliales bacterium]